MTIQETDIEKFKDFRSPPAWRRFWERISFLLPLWVFSVICALEIVFFSAWRFGKSWIELLAPLIGMIAVLSLPIAMLAWTTFRRRSAMQEVEVDGEGIKILGRNPKSMPWSRVGRLILRKTPGVPGVSEFSIGYVRSPGMSLFTRPLFWIKRIPPAKRRSRDLVWVRLILQNSDQIEDLRKGMDILRTENPLIPELKIAGNGSAASPWLMVLSMFFLLHGLPLFGVGLENHDRSKHIVSEVATGREDKMVTVVGPALARHFHDEQTFRKFLIVIGASLTAAGIGTYAASILVVRRERRNAASQQAFSSGT